MAKLICINIFPEKKAPKQEVSSAKTLKNGGLIGDFHVIDTARAISIIGIETKEALTRDGIVGLCTSKFSTNLVTEGIELNKLKPNARIMVGEAELKIMQIGKECFAECGMDDRSKCPLKSECAFAVALNSGIITVGCDVRVIS